MVCHWEEVGLLLSSYTHFPQRPEASGELVLPTPHSAFWIIWRRLLATRGNSNPSSITTSLFQKGLLKASVSASKGPLSTANTWCHYQTKKALGRGEATDLKGNFSWGEILEACGAAFWCWLFKGGEPLVPLRAGWNKMPEIQRKREDNVFCDRETDELLDIMGPILCP